MEVIKTRGIGDWCNVKMLGFTQRQLVDFVEAGASLKVYCVAYGKKADKYEIFIEIETNDPDAPSKRMVLISHRKERKFFKSHTACRLLFDTLGLDEVHFWSSDKRESEGLVLNEKLEAGRE